MGRGSITAQEPGTVVQMRRNGEYQNFVVITQNYMETGYALISQYVSEDISKTVNLSERIGSSNSPFSMTDCAGMIAAENNFFDSLDPTISVHIPEIEIPFNVVTSTTSSVTAYGVENYVKKIFLPSFGEMGGSYDSGTEINDGSEPIPYLTTQEGRNNVNLVDAYINQYMLRSIYPRKGYDSSYYQVASYQCDNEFFSSWPLQSGLSTFLRFMFCLPSTIYVDDNGYLVENTPPVITGTDGDLGTFGETSPTYAYTVTDQQGGTVSVTEALDGETLRTYDVTLGQQNTLTIPSATYLTTLNGQHTLTITATDSVGASTVRTETFTKNVTSCAFTQTAAFTVDDMPTRCVVNIQGAFPEGSVLTVQICNNGNDASPTWETITQQALLGQKYFFQNETKTAANWGVKVQASLSRGTAEGDCYISSIGGVFQ